MRMPCKLLRGLKMIKKLLVPFALIFSIGISADELNSGDTAWILTSTALVYL